MKYFKYIILLLFILSAGSLQAQKGSKKKNFKSKQVSPAALLEQARDIKEKSPADAINLLEEVVGSTRKKRNRTIEAEAFVLLGNIYEQINQDELALERYGQALSIVQYNKKDNASKAVVFERMGQLNLALGNTKAAEEYFKECISWTDDEVLRLTCQEGLADVKLFKKDTLGVVAILDSIENTYAGDSLVTARNQARRSQMYLQQNDYSKASESFQNSINTLPNKNVLSKQDYAPFEKAQTELLNSSNLSTVDKIGIRSNIGKNATTNFSTNSMVIENLKIAELFESDNNYFEAEKFVVAAKDLIDVKTDAKVAADVYKKSSEYNQRKGKVDMALSDLELYIVAKETAIKNLENTLAEQIDIVKGQQRIDIQKRDFDLEEKDKTIMESQLVTQKIIIGLLSLVLVASLIFFYFLYKNVKEKRKANQLLLLKSLRTQMNPHFIFNALNSVNNFIAKNDEKAANKFLSDFSRLMRKVLEHSQKDFISFEEEMELNELYLKLEHFRFRDKFDYTFENNAKQHSVEVPPMLIQPFIENAIWHGLRYKEGMGKLSMTVNEVENDLIILIKDNGIGRERSMALKTKNQKKYKSTGMENVSRSIALINEVYGKNYTLKVRDIDGDAGTEVEIRIPI